MRTPHATATILACTISMAILSACGSTLPGIARPSEIDVRILDTGKYPTEPSNAHDDDYLPSFYSMKNVASMRLAEYVASAYDIDPRMKFGQLSWSIGSGTMPEELGRPTDMEPIAQRHQMMYGFKTNGADKNVSVFAADWPTLLHANATTVGTVVMQFPDADHARQAATEFHDTDFGAYHERNEQVALPKYPAALAHWRSGSPFLRAVLAHGPYVVAFLVSANGPDLNALVSLTEKAYDTQLPLLDQLAPLSEEEMLRLPWDPHHLLSRTLNPTDSRTPAFDDSHAVLGPRGILLYAKDRARAREHFTAMGAEEFAVSGDTLVVRTPEPAIARKIVAQRITPNAVAGDADPPSHLPDSACVENQSEDYDAKRFTCIVIYHEYVGFVTGNQLLDAQQRAAAQYSIFANSR